jgi:DNA repair protein RadC
MDRRFSGHTNAIPSSPTFDAAHLAGNVQDNRERLGLSNADYASVGHMEASSATTDFGQRQVLERLLAFAEGSRPEKIAGELLERFGSLGAIFASLGSLNENDPSRNLLNTVQQTLNLLLKAEVCKKPIISTSDDLINYLAFSIGHLRVEEVRTLYLDCKNRLISDKLISRGSVMEAPIYRREILKQALELGATAFLLVHNHPSGDPRPSQSDIDVTRSLWIAARELDICMHDHLIIARNGWFSFRNGGYIS